MRTKLFAVLGGLAVLSVGLSAQTAFTSAGPVIVPASNSGASTDPDKRRVHTNLRYISIAQIAGARVQSAGSPPFSGYLYETPASIACVYNLLGHQRGNHSCNPNVVTQNPSGGGGAIAIVDAYDNPTALADLQAFSAQFGLPLTSNQFQVVYASGTQPAQDPNGGWEIEESLDVQWAHAMAPNAQIFLVEAASNYDSDLFPAVQLASQLVAAAGGGEVSMSWGEGEFSDELSLDAYFTTPGVVYFASSGDGPGTIYPSVSPNVVAAGGTSISRDPNSGNFILENAWQSGGGGMSLYEPRPRFQNSIRGLVGATRGTPDISFDANPDTGVWVLATSQAGGAPAGWYVVGGTSVSSPSLAGITNALGAFHASSAEQNSANYKGAGSFRDITYGNCGIYMSNFTANGWDFCTGLGSVLGGH